MEVRVLHRDPNILRVPHHIQHTNKPLKTFFSPKREESAIREYEWQKSNLPPESLTLALRKRYAPTFCYTSVRVSPTRVKQPFFYFENTPFHSFFLSFPFPFFFSRREELLQENLAQRVDLQQEWVALIGALSNVLQTTLETSSQSRFDIRYRTNLR